MILRASAHQGVGDGRAVGAVNLRVTVHATASLPHVDHIFAVRHIGDLRHSLPGSSRCINTALSAQGTDPTRHMRRMALLAKHGGTRSEHAGHHTAVCVMAIGTILNHWCMLLHKRATFFSMACVASVIDAVTLHQLGTCGPMGVVAIRTSHLALGNGVMRWFGQLATLLGMAGIANFGLPGLC